MKVHLIGCVNVIGETAACGKWANDWLEGQLTGEVAAVTCRSCIRSRDYISARLRPEDRTPALANYRSTGAPR